MSSPSYAVPSSMPSSMSSSPAAPSAPAAGPTSGALLLRRGIGAVGLLGIALIHVIDLPGKLEETPYLGVGYGLLVVAALLLAEALRRRGDRVVWFATALLAASTVLGYVLSRTTGLPGATDDIGNWLEPLGVASLFVEGVVVLLAGTALAASARD